MANTKERLAAFTTRNARAGDLNFADEITKTTQEGKSLDINAIIARYRKTGILPVNNRTPTYGDFSAVEDFLQAQNTYLRAKQQFDALPARLRSQLQNDPARFLDWITKDENREEAVKLGLIKAPAGAEPARSDKQGGKDNDTGNPEK